MGKKLRQVTDSIHGTIYLSELESELISTPYFYRLHDIYQSSTVYMTFPSNRTKRYEHSLGTMALASRLLFSSVTNADFHSSDVLFIKLKEYFFDIKDKVFEGDKSENLYFKYGANNDIADLFDKVHEIDNINIIDCIRNAMKNGVFNDNSLDHYQYYPTDCITEDKNNGVENVFLYRCLLQAVRIVALFHDVGHPPYSHIIEDVLKDLYNLVLSDKSANLVSRKVEKFKKCMEPFLTNDPDKSFKCQRLFTDSCLSKSAPHERIGLCLLNYAINDVIPKKIASIASKSVDPMERIVHMLYYIVIAEFVFAILTEKDVVFKSFHKIVDGVLDADRLDYIVRDSLNSGVDWGKIPYERIINSAKLHYLDEDSLGNEIKETEKPFIIAYPKKVSDDIEDLLLVRYKIFARINFHHRCMKTSVALQAAVKYLAIDYLSNEQNSKCINSDISALWLALDQGIGNKKIRIIRWNDSWLISALHDAFVYLHINGDRIDVERRKLKENLEEILLSKRNYYTLLKRGRDNSDFLLKILKKANIDEKKIGFLENEEYKKYSSSHREITADNMLDNPKCEARDSIFRIHNIFDTLDLEFICKTIPLEGCDLYQVLDEALNESDLISNYGIIINDGRKKNGLSLNRDLLDGIYVYINDVYERFNEDYSLKSQIKAIQRNVPWLYVYFVPKNDDDIEQLSNILIDLLAEKVAVKLRKRYDELFPKKSIDD